LFGWFILNSGGWLGNKDATFDLQRFVAGYVEV
jgi:hypothetical protein